MKAKSLILSYDLVPGISAAGQHMVALVPALSERGEIDAMSLKGDHLPHIQRMGSARMMRVPVSSDGFQEQVAAYQRAVHRQLDSENYDLVYCSDLISAHAAVTHSTAESLPAVLEFFDLSSNSVCQQPGFVDADGKMCKRLIHQETKALKAMKRVLVHSERVQKQLLAMGVPAARILLLPCALDEKLFNPPSIEVPADPNACVVALPLGSFSEQRVDEVLLFWKKLPATIKSLSVRVPVFRKRPVLLWT